jgi:hypothetical protein
LVGGARLEECILVEDPVGNLLCIHKGLHGSLQRANGRSRRQQGLALDLLFLSAGHFVFQVIVLVTLPFINPVGQTRAISEFHHVVLGLVGLVSRRGTGTILVLMGSIDDLQLGKRQDQQCVTTTTTTYVTL